MKSYRDWKYWWRRLTFQPYWRYRFGDQRYNLHSEKMSYFMARFQVNGDKNMYDQVLYYDDGPLPEKEKKGEEKWVDIQSQ